MKRTIPFIFILLTLLGCGARFKERKMDQISDMLSGSGAAGSVFTSDNDPEFIADALPFALKVYEGLIQANPDHAGLYTTTAIGYSSYSYAALHFPADTLPDIELTEKRHLQKRAKNLYLRARGYAIKGLEIKHPNFLKSLARKSDSLLPLLNKEDTDLMYWAGMSWLGAFTMDKFDMKLALSFPSAKKLLFRVHEIDPNYGDGAINNFLITYYGGTPESMGGSLDSARYYYEKSLENPKVPTADPHIAYARTVLVAEKNREEYLSVLQKAAKIKPTADSANILVRTIKQTEAKWLINHVDDFFLE